MLHKELCFLITCTEKLMLNAPGYANENKIEYTLTAVLKLIYFFHL